MLLLAAVVTIYIVLGILYESFIHPLTILTGLPSAARRRAGRARAVRHGPERDRDDRPPDADRHRQEERDHDDRRRAGHGSATGKRPGDAIREACLLRFRPIMMTTLAALMGALPIALGHRRRRRAAPAAGRRRGRRPAGLAGADAVHHAGALPLHGGPVACAGPDVPSLGRGARRRSRRGRTGYRRRRRFSRIGWVKARPPSAGSPSVANSRSSSGSSPASNGSRAGSAARNRSRTAAQDGSTTRLL